MVIEFAQFNLSSAMPSHAAPAESFFSMLEPLLPFGFIAVVVLTILKLACMNEARVRAYFQERGGKLIHMEHDERESSWARKYQIFIPWIRYEDRDGNLHVARCKAGMLTGVYLTDDKIIRYGKPHEASQNVQADLQAENQRLKDEIERLQRLQPGWMPSGDTTKQWS